MRLPPFAAKYRNDSQIALRLADEILRLYVLHAAKAVPRASCGAHVRLTPEHGSERSTVVKRRKCNQSSSAYLARSKSGREDARSS